MWFENKETGLKFDVENQDLINNLKKDGNFEIVEKEEMKKEKTK